MAAMAMTGAQALGVHHMWGFSPARDELEGVDLPEAAGPERPLRVLLANPSDIRHLLATVARRRRHGLPPVHFYICEHQIEVLARHLLLLQIVADWELPVRQRATVFLEVFGNAHVQERTQRYIHRCAKELEALVCDGRGALEDLVDLDSLKYRDRDALVAAFKSWDPKVLYDVATLRDHRLRAHLATRYDARAGIVDWDYQMRVKPAASIIHSTLYKEWRLSGLAFEFGDQRYDQPNRTLGSYAEGFLKKGKDQGIKKEILGFWTDVVNSPYFSFGVDTHDRPSPGTGSALKPRSETDMAKNKGQAFGRGVETAAQFAENLFYVANAGTGTEQHRHHTVEIAVFNLLSYLWEIETGEPYAMTKDHDIYSGLGNDASDMAWAAQQSAGGSKEGTAQAEGEAQSEAAAEAARREQALSRASCIVESLTDLRVTLLKGGVDDLMAKAQTEGQAYFGGFFDVAHLSPNSEHHLQDPRFQSLLARKQTAGQAVGHGGVETTPGRVTATVVVDTGKFIVPMTGEQEKQLEAKVDEFASVNGLEKRRAASTPAFAVYKAAKGK